MRGGLCICRRCRCCVTRLLPGGAVRAHGLVALLPAAPAPYHRPALPALFAEAYAITVKDFDMRLTRSRQQPKDPWDGHWGVHHGEREEPMPGWVGGWVGGWGGRVCKLAYLGTSGNQPIHPLLSCALLCHARASTRINYMVVQFCPCLPCPALPAALTQDLLVDTFNIQAKMYHTVSAAVYSGTQQYNAVRSTSGTLTPVAPAQDCRAAPRPHRVTTVCTGGSCFPRC